MSEDHSNTDTGVVATVHDLLRTRPQRNMTGFAPGGRVSTHLFGTNHSVFRGHGMEFDESREYQAGDDTRSIDWRITARTGVAHTKLYREERERPVYVLVDCRRMMQFGSRVRFKSVMAARLAAMLCWVGIDGNDRVGGVLLSTSGLSYYPPSRTRSGMLAFLHAISDATMTHLEGSEELDSESAESTLAKGIQRLHKVCRPGSLAFIISDYNDFDESCERELKRLCLRAHVTNLFVHDPLDEVLPLGGDFRLSDGCDVLSLDALDQHVHSDHATRFAHRRERLESLARQRSMAFLSLSTADQPETALHPHRTNVRTRQSSPGASA